MGSPVVEYNNLFHKGAVKQTICKSVLLREHMKEESNSHDTAPDYNHHHEKRGHRKPQKRKVIDMVARCKASKLKKYRANENNIRELEKRKKKVKKRKNLSS